MHDDDEFGLDCDCGPRAPHPKGWGGRKELPIDGTNWPLPFAAKQLGIPERHLRDLVRIVGLPPAGTMKMATYRRPGRQPLAYPAASLIQIAETVRRLGETLGTQDP